MGEDDETWKTRWSIQRNHPYSLFRTTQSHFFLALPPEMREQIGTFLDAADVRKMREVCACFKFDMEQINGVSVVVQGIQGGNQELGLQTQLEWLQTVVVRKLVLSYDGPNLDFGAVRLKNPFLLKELVLKVSGAEFGDPARVGHVGKLLESCPRLASLEVEFEFTSQAQAEAIRLLTLTCLKGKSQLKRLKFSGEFLDLGDPALLDPAWTPIVQFPVPTQLKDLSVLVPWRSNRSTLDWHNFLNTQTQLLKLDFSCRGVNWDYFNGVMLNCAPRLRDLRLQLGNLVIGVAGDWATLALGSKLECLCLDGGWPSAPAINLDRVKLSGLRKLELRAILLTLEDLSHILVGGTGLSDLCLVHWTRSRTNISTSSIVNFERLQK